MRTTAIALLVALLPATPGAAQHEHHARNASPYADQEDSGIAALSLDEVRQLRDGAGMGMARAAELNRYPGPKHVLELAGELGLSPPQKSAVEGVHEEMRQAAVRLGEAIVEREEQLQRRFAHRHIDEALLRRTTSEIAALYGELRFAHLAAHLKTAALLSTEQAERYDRLRGYR